MDLQGGTPGQWPAGGVGGGHGGGYGHGGPPPPEGATIGVALEECPRSSLSEHVPLIVELGVGIVEARGLESVGVYRVPGNTAAVAALTESLNRGFDHLNRQDPRWNDVNVISSLLKSFFRKLPDPLITSEVPSVGLFSLSLSLSLFVFPQSDLALTLP